jgi:hypothetical protein
MLPYLYTIAMEFLIKEMNRAATMERLVRVTLARNASRLTHSLYKDNVV